LLTSTIESMTSEHTEMSKALEHPLEQWIDINLLAHEYRGILTGDLPIPEGRFVRVGANIFRDIRFYTGFATFCGFSMTLVFAFVFPALGHEIEWISIGVSFFIGLGALYITRKAKGPEVPERKGMYFFEDRVIVFDNEKAFVMLRNDIKLIHKGKEEPYLSFFRHDNSRIYFGMEYIDGVSRRHEFFFATRKWIDKGEAVFGELQPLKKEKGE
jgi:hypothetical protein